MEFLQRRISNLFWFCCCIVPACVGILEAAGGVEVSGGLESRVEILELGMLAVCLGGAGLLPTRLGGAGLLPTRPGGAGLLPTCLGGGGPLPSSERRVASSTVIGVPCLCFHGGLGVSQTSSPLSKASMLSTYLSNSESEPSLGSSSKSSNNSSLMITVSFVCYLP